MKVVGKFLHDFPLLRILVFPEVDEKIAGVLNGIQLAFDCLRERRETVKNAKEEKAGENCVENAKHVKKCRPIADFFEFSRLVSGERTEVRDVKISVDVVGEEDCESGRQRDG